MGLVLLHAFISSYVFRRSTRARRRLLGVSIFYWYQVAWGVIAASGCWAIVYRKLKILEGEKLEGDSMMPCAVERRCNAWSIPERNNGGLMLRGFSEALSFRITDAGY